MSFSKISFYSVVFFTSISLHNQISAMEEIKQSIKQELSILDNSIITMEKALKSAKQQRNKDKEQFDICDQTFTNPTQYLANCSDLYKAYYGTQHIRFHQFNGTYYRGDITLSKSFPANSKLKASFMDGSRCRCLGIKEAIKKDKHKYNQFQDGLTRGERVNDIVYLQLLKEKIQSNNHKINVRNSCISNQ